MARPIPISAVLILVGAAGVALAIYLGSPRPETPGTAGGDPPLAESVTHPTSPAPPTPAPVPPSLHAVILSGDVKAVEFALAAGASSGSFAPDAPAELAGKPPIVAAAERGSVVIAGLLLDAGADVNAPDRSARTAVIVAAGPDGSLELLKLLVESGADVNRADSAGTTALMMAALSGDPDRVFLLLDAGADAKPKARDGRTAAEFARAARDVSNADLIAQAISDAADR